MRFQGTGGVGGIHTPNIRYSLSLPESQLVIQTSFTFNEIEYAMKFLGKICNSFQVLIRANHASEAFIILQSSEGVLAMSETTFRHIVRRQDLSFLETLDYHTNI